MTNPSVVFISTQMEAAGVQTRSFAMQQELNRRGVPTTLAFLYKKRPAFVEGETVMSMLDRPPANPADYFRILRALWRLLTTTRPSAVVGFAHYASPLVCTYGALIGIKRRVATQTNPASSMPAVARWLDLLCGCSGIYTANIAASQSVYDSYSAYPLAYRRRLVVVENGIKFTGSTLSRDAARDRFGLPRGVKLLVACGRLSRQKNHRFLLPVLAQLPDTHLAILGDGELRDELLEEAGAMGLSDRFHLIGERSHDEVADFLHAGDVFVFPSLFEAFGLAVAEAMAAGLPVIASDHPAIAHVVSDGGLVLPLDSTQWVASVQELAADCSLSKSLGEKGRARSETFSFEKMLAGFARATLGPVD